MADITLTTRAADAGVGPSVEVLVSDLTGVASITVSRTARNRVMQVRGMVALPVSGAVSRIDFEVPLNVPVAYRAELFDSAGISMGFTDSVTVASVASEDSWLHNPLDPSGAFRVSVAAPLETTAQVLSRPTPGSVVYPRGRRVGVVISEPRRGLSGFVFDVACETIEEADRLQATVGDYSSTTVPVLCIRPGSGFPPRIPSPLFLSVFDLKEEDVDVKWGGQRTNHRMEGDEVSPPVPGLFIPLLTYADLNAFYATYNAFKADNASYLAASRRYELAGSADA